jgi:hypothetical protein
MNSIIPFRMINPLNGRRMFVRLFNPDNFPPIDTKYWYES